MFGYRPAGLPTGASDFLLSHHVSMFGYRPEDPPTGASDFSFSDGMSVCSDTDPQARRLVHLTINSSHHLNKGTNSGTRASCRFRVSPTHETRHEEAAGWKTFFRISFPLGLINTFPNRTVIPRVSCEEEMRNQTNKQTPFVSVNTCAGSETNDPITCETGRKGRKTLDMKRNCVFLLDVTCVTFHPASADGSCTRNVIFDLVENLGFSELSHSYIFVF